MSKIDTNETLLSAAVSSWMRDVAPQGILLTDRELNVVSWNRWLEERSGRRANDVLGKNLLQLYPELVDRGLAQNYKDAIAGQVRLLSQRLHGYLLPMPAAVQRVFAHAAERPDFVQSRTMEKSLEHSQSSMMLPSE